MAVRAEGIEVCEQAVLIGWPRLLPASLRAERLVRHGSTSDGGSNPFFPARLDGLLRRFAPLHKPFAFVAGNDVEGHAFSFSRHDLREVLQENLALEIRGRREDRVRAAPAVSRAMSDSGRTRAYRFGGITPAFPAQWLYGLYDFVLVTGFLATIIIGSFRFRRQVETP